MSTIRPMFRSLRATQISRQQRNSFQRRLASTTPPSSSSSSSSSSRRKYLPLALLPAGLLLIPALSADTSSEGDASSLSKVPFSSLIRQWFVWASCSAPGVVDYSPSLLTFMSKTPLRGPTEWFVRNTFFAQFVPGETVEECIPAMEEMRSRAIGTMLNYSAEVDESQLREVGPAKEERDRKEREKKLAQVLYALDKAGEYEKSLPVEQRGVTGFALKITGLVDCNVLERASYTLLRMRPLMKSSTSTTREDALFVPYPGTPQSSDHQIICRTPELGLGDGKELLSLQGRLDDMGVLESDKGLQDGDMEELRELWYKLKRIGQKAKEQGINLFVDAEHTWYQPALDGYTLILSQEFNRPPTSASEPWTGPLIFGTYQSYLTRQPSHLAHAIQHAEANGYALGVKLVRGAYFEQERKKWVDEGRYGADPIWPSKPATDIAYDGSISTLMSTLAAQLKSAHPDRALSIVFGTHNPGSCNLVCDNLLRAGLAEEDAGGKLRLRDDVRGKIRVAQLYGMKDDLTDGMANRFVNDGKPVALKYVAYGKLSEVMPYLGRRAIENKSLMTGEDGASAERGRVAAEMKRRIFG